MLKPAKKPPATPEMRAAKRLRQAEGREAEQLDGAIMKAVLGVPLSAAEVGGKL